MRVVWLAAAWVIATPGLATAQDDPHQDLLAAFYGPPDLTMLTYYSAGWTHLGLDDQYPKILEELGQNKNPNRNSFSHGWGALITFAQFVAVLESSHAGTASTRNQRSVQLSTDDLSVQVGYAALKLPAATGFIAVGAGLHTVGLGSYIETAQDFDDVVTMNGTSQAFEISARTLVLKASAGFELAILPPGDPWGIHAGLIAGVAYAPLDPKYRLFGSTGLIDSTPELTGRSPNLAPWAFSVSLIIGVGGGL